MRSRPGSGALDCESGGPFSTPLCHRPSRPTEGYEQLTVSEAESVVQPRGAFLLPGPLFLRAAAP